MTLNLTPEVLKRVEELKQIGFGVIFTGMTGSNNSMDFNLCYWKYLRGNTVSAVFPYPEAAWRDAIRTWDETLSKVEDNPGIHRHTIHKSQGKTWDEVFDAVKTIGPSVETMQRLLESAGYEFCFTARKGWSCRQLPNNADGLIETAVRDAWKHAIKNGIQVEPVEDQPYGFKVQLPWRQRRDLLEMAGYQIFADCWVEPNGSTTAVKTLAVAIDEAWEHAVENGLLRKDSDDLLAEVPEQVIVHTVPIVEMKRVLEQAGYSILFSAHKGWYCPSISQSSDTTVSFEDTVKNVWRHCVNKGSN